MKFIDKITSKLNINEYCAVRDRSIKIELSVFVLFYFIIWILLIGTSYYLQALAVLITTFVMIAIIFRFILLDNNLNFIKNKMPNRAVIYIDGKREDIAIEELTRGHIAIVDTGEIVPADGSIFYGETMVDASLVLGCDVQKTVDDIEIENDSKNTISLKKGDKVYAGYKNLGKPFQIEVEKKLEDSLIMLLQERCKTAVESEKALRYNNFRICVIPAFLLLLTGLTVAVIMPFLSGHSIIRTNFFTGIYLCLMAIGILSILYLRFQLGKLSIANITSSGISISKVSDIKDIATVEGILIGKDVVVVEDNYRLERINEIDIDKIELLGLISHVLIDVDTPEANAIKQGYIEMVEYLNGGSVGLEDISLFRRDVVENFEKINDDGYEARVAGRYVVIGNKKLLSYLNIRNLPDIEENLVAYIAIDKKYAGFIELSRNRKDGTKYLYSMWKYAGIKKYAKVVGDINEDRQAKDELINDAKYKNVICLRGEDNSQLSEWNPPEIAEIYNDENVINMIFSADVEKHKLTNDSIHIFNDDTGQLSKVKDLCKRYINRKKIATLLGSALCLCIFGAGLVLKMPVYIPLALFTGVFGLVNYYFIRKYEG
ncbi:MAG: hypothetical protein PUI85_00730 [Eubacteriales bacterium]|nr:hypothetical protein [Eubacteriales bacterium]MDY3332670.1 hypothetical protein [Gallibacter sp.]